ncbi:MULTISPECIES: DUF1073 domain-containing protein [Lactobacillus]|uniref:DUF1073 domain-containing protein n=1 Tax=Lactobacillus xujianguonis TaxID=2495899 RepID=A0A437ST52_9LACO|nr:MULTISPECIES: DUF1073 domain-containing protein [Lactobacillus]RVU70022.1 DUF1073 domain-containing protein [Lactobacillus xujianguonis]RVU73447.1 DUF1073 domain-containing protein [Lactobacillus xujianguonis]
MGIFNRKDQKKSKRRIPPTSFKMNGYREDFMDYESKLAGQPQRFGDTQPIYTSLMAIQDYDLLNNIYHKNGIAHKVVSKPAEDATRNGWRIIIPSDPKKQAQYQKALDDLDLKRILCQELIYYRLHGDGYITYGIYAPTLDNSTNVPLDPANQVISNVAFVHAFGQNHVEKLIANSDPTSLDYMKEAAVVITDTQPGDKVDSQGNIQSGSLSEQTKNIVIDKSRYSHISLDKLEDDGTGVSILTRCWDQIHTLDTALYSVGKILYAYVVNVLTDDGAADSIDFDATDPLTKQEFKEQNKALSQDMGTDAVLNLHTGQSFERHAVSVSGIDNLLLFAWQQLAAASNIPKSVLLGEQAGTLAGATTDVANYYDGVKAMQEELLRPQLERIIQLLMWSTDVADGSEAPDSIEWKLEFNPLWSPDAKTMSEINYTDTQAEVLKVNSGIEDTDEALQNLASQNNNLSQSMENKTDSVDEISLEDAERIMKTLKEGIRRAQNKSTH